MNLNNRFLSPAVCLLILLTALLNGCAALSDQPPPPEELARKALANYSKGNYYQALEQFDTIREHYPFTRFSLMAELKSADSHYYQREYDEALPLYLEFEKDHPTHQLIPYVIFQIGRCHYNSLKSIDRDPGAARETISALQRLIKTYPDSAYTEEAGKLIRKSRNFLAEHELYVAEFYFRTGEYGQARKRAEELVEVYPASPAAEEAGNLMKRLDNLP